MPPDARAAFQAELAAWLLDGYGLALGVLGSGALDDALGTRQRLSGVPDLAAYADRWRQQSAEREALLERLLVGETWFFREWPAFEYLAAHCMADARAYSPAQPLRILTLPCSTGEEAWSIAAILHEAGLNGDTVVIDAVDVNPIAIQTAQRGRYPTRKLRHQPSGRWTALLHETPHRHLLVDDRLRSMVRWQVGNALDTAWLRAQPAYHAIFCRNMLIYMSEPARRQIAATLRDCLRPAGLLFLGHAEQPAKGLGWIRAGRDGAFAWRQGPDPETRPRMPDRSPSPAVQQRLKPPVSRPVALPSLSPSPSPPASPVGARPDPGVDLPRIRQLADAGRYEEALEWLNAPAVSASLEAEAHALAGILLGVLGRKSEAIVRLRQALFLDPAHAESLTHLALLLEESGDNAGAERLRSRLAANAGRIGA